MSLRHPKAILVALALVGVTSGVASAQIYQIPNERFPAKLQVLRAGVVDQKLDVLARLTSRASGDVEVTYVANGTTTKFSAPIETGSRNLKISKSLSKAAARNRTGILTLNYNGDENTYGDNVRLRAAPVKANLKRKVARITSAGRLQVSGTISQRARGVVRIRLAYPFSGTADATEVFYNASIKNGTWAIDQEIPAAAAKVGGQLNIQFTGYRQARMRGEQDAKKVNGTG